MLVHTVLFWLRKDLDGDEVTDFRLGLESLTKIDAAEAVYVGTPAATAERPVVDRGYDFCLTVLFKDVEAHDAYQAHARHNEFIERYSNHWKQVKVYDAD